MATATDPQSLLSSSNVQCYNNYSAQFTLLKLALLQIIANSLSPMTPTDPQSLLSSVNVRCYNSYGSFPLLELALLQIIANNIGTSGGGGGGALTGASANPNTGGVVPSNTSAGAIYYQVPSDGSGTNVWIWDIVTQAWRQFSA